MKVRFMWHTSVGNRELAGAEAALLKVAITAVVEQIKEESSGYVDQAEYGIRLFDELPWSQRLVLLEQIATYLFTKTREPLELTAVNEAAIGALFEHIRWEIELEIVLRNEDPLQPDTQWRELVSTAYEECFRDEGADGTIEEWDDFSQPDITSEDRETWSDLIESLANRILWDRDFEMEDLFLDEAPEKTEIMKQYLGIDSDYFAAAAPDAVTDEAMERIYERLDELAQER
jgi:hypothetical protein